MKALQLDAPHHQQVLDAKGAAHKMMVDLALGPEAVSAFEYVGGPLIWETDTPLDVFNAKLGTRFDKRTESRNIVAAVLQAYRTRDKAASAA
jgi:hypothetical protein